MGVKRGRKKRNSDAATGSKSSGNSGNLVIRNPNSIEIAVIKPLFRRANRLREEHQFVVAQLQMELGKLKDSCNAPDNCELHMVDGVWVQRAGVTNDGQPAFLPLIMEGGNGAKETKGST